jgi:hypothetical protein
MTSSKLRLVWKLTWLSPLRRSGSAHRPAGGTPCHSWLASPCICSKDSSPDPSNIYRGHLRPYNDPNKANVETTNGDKQNYFHDGHCYTCLTSNDGKSAEWTIVDDELSSCYKAGCSHDTYYGQWWCGNRGGYPYYAQCLGNDEWSEWILCDNGCPADNVKEGPSDPFATYCSD